MSSGLLRRSVLSVLTGTALVGTPRSFAQVAPQAVQRTESIRGRDGWLFLHWEDPAQVDTTRLPRNLAIFRDAAAILRDSRIEVGFVVIPAKFRVYRDMLPADAAFSPDAENRYNLVLSELRNGNAIVPDLLAPMLTHRSANPARHLWFKADTHWTPTGASVAAAETARAVRGNLQLPQSRPPRVRLGAAVTRTRLRRDLTEFLPAADRAAYRAEAYTIRPPVAASGGLLDSDTSDVVVIGNSYTQPDFNFVPELSAALERSVALDWKNQNVGPFRTMLDYLRSPMFRQERPRLILWTIIEAAAGLEPENRQSYMDNAMLRRDFLNGVRQAVAGQA